MVDTPTIWKAEHRLNKFTDSVQNDLAMVDVGNGRYFAVWSDFSGDVNPFGINVVGQIFDAEGNAFGDPFLVSKTAGDNFEGEPALATRRHDQLTATVANTRCGARLNVAQNPYSPLGTDGLDLYGRLHRTVRRTGE
ncbi:MAG: hypothetical protein GY798_35260 [Hyphomicrobiales bacterium]|nr:hypothetical protein [Hyphomicrobiales bacterium]